MENMIEMNNLRLEKPVVVRKMPMTQKGCDMLRAIREYQVGELTRQKGLNVSLPFPTSLHLMLVDYCKMKGIDLS